ncbi:MAG: GFA family protein [Gammaproteobacteria bacterium]|nr:GFA family protein [Gammaproteobacteria bacterium]
MGKEHVGRCHCGAIRYRMKGEPIMVEYCHCDSCRRLSGSVVSTFIGYARESFGMIDGEPVYYQSSPGTRRSFRGACGTRLFFESDDYPEEIYISVGTLEDLETWSPDRHVWVSDKVSWHVIGDDLAQHDAFSGSGAAADGLPYKKPA